MPPHCDTRDGPVVRAAQKALATGNVNYVLIWVPEESEKEVQEVFGRVMRSRTAGDEARNAVDDWFFETVIRLHRAGEGAAFTGLKPAGLDEGPIVPRAEKAIESGDPGETIGIILSELEKDLTRRFHRVMETRDYDIDDVPLGREFIKAFIDWVVYSHHIFMQITGGKVPGEHHGDAGAGEPR